MAKPRGAQGEGNDEGLKALSVRVLRAAPNEEAALDMRANVLGGFSDAWEVGPRSAVELKEAAMHLERAAALSNAPAMRARLATIAASCRRQAESM